MEASRTGTSSSSSSRSSASSSHSGSGWEATGSTLSHEHAARESSEIDMDVSDAYCAVNATETEESGCKRPRSCSACLRVAGCLVNATGQCVSAALHYNESLDFRAATLFENKSLALRTSVDVWNTSSNATTAAVQQWIFPSMAVSYCAPDDTACTICKLSIFPAVGASPDMRFCVGANNCVCTALCDSPQLDEARHKATVCDPSKAPKKPLPQAAVWIIGASVALVICGLLYWWMWRRTSERQEERDDESDRCIANKDPYGVKSSAPGATSMPSVYQAPQLDTPIMEMSAHESPRFSLDTARRHGRSHLPSAE